MDQKIIEQVNIDKVEGDVGQVGDQVGGDKTTVGDVTVGTVNTFISQEVTARRMKDYVGALGLYRSAVQLVQGLV